MKTYKVDIAGEHEGVTSRTEDGLTVVTLYIEGVGDVTVPLTAVTEVKPPLPLVFTVDVAGPFWAQRDGTAVNLADDKVWSREDLDSLGSAPVPMVAGPPPWDHVGLPWKHTTEDDDEVEVRIMKDGNGKTSAVLDLVVAADTIEALPNGQARAWAFVPADQVARALWTAADQAEAARS